MWQAKLIRFTWDTVERLYCRHHWDSLKSLIKKLSYFMDSLFITLMVPFWDSVLMLLCKVFWSGKFLGIIVIINVIQVIVHATACTIHVHVHVGLTCTPLSSRHLLPCRCFANVGNSVYTCEQPYWKEQQNIAWD